MNREPVRVVLITGASSGIGKACAEGLSAKGFKVYGTSRKPVPGKLPYEMIRLDVADSGSVEEAVGRVMGQEGRIDILINNAGILLTGPIEDTTVEEARALFETNFFGVIRVSRAVIPHMRRQGGGVIVNIGSLAGLMGLPFQGIYSASKFALEGMSQALRMELKRFKIHVVLIEPGDIKTEIRAHGLKTSVSELYGHQFERTFEVIQRNEEKGENPEFVADRVFRILRERAPRARHVVGTRTQELAVFLKRLLPSDFFLRVIASHYRID